MRLIGAAGAVLLIACATPQPASAPPVAEADLRAQVHVAWDAYMRNVRKFNPDSIAAMFTPSGTMYEPGMAVTGHDSLLAFMKTLVGIKVDTIVAPVDTIEVWGDHAILWGRFDERYTMPGQPPATETGRYVVQWSKQADNAWRIDRFMTQPAPAPAKKP